MRYITSHIFILVLLWGCTNKRESNGPFSVLIEGMKNQVLDIPELPVYTGNVLKIRFKPKNKSTASISNVTFTPILTPEGSFIGTFDKIINFEKKLYILDKKSNSIFILTMDGEFIDKISRVGKGEGEYIKLSDFDIDRKKRELVVCSITGRKLIHYDLNGRFMKELRSPYWMREFYVTQSGNYCFITEGKNQTGYQLLILDSLGKAVRKALPSKRILNKFNIYSSNSILLRHLNKQLLLLPFSKDIYTITEDRLELRYSLDFGEEEFDLESSEFRNIDDMLYSLKKSKKNVTSGAYFETDSLVGFDIRQGGKGLLTLYSKVSKDVLTTNLWLIEDKLVLPFPSFTLNGKLISLVPADWLFLHKEELITKYDITHIFEGLTKMSNSVLVSFEINGF